MWGRGCAVEDPWKDCVGQAGAGVHAGPLGTRMGSAAHLPLTVCVSMCMFTRPRLVTAVLSSSNLAHAQNPNPGSLSQRGDVLPLPGNKPGYSTPPRGCALKCGGAVL